MRDDEYEAPAGGEELIPMAPREALDIWLERQQMDKSESTVQSYRYRVRPFVEFLEDEGIENLNDLNGRHLLRFDSMRRSSGDVQKNTLNNQLGTIRQFLEFGIRANAVEPAVASQIDIPQVSKDERINREKLPTQRAKDILAYLDRFEYASRDHVLAFLLWETGARIGSLRALDLEDVYLEEDDLDRLRYQEDLDVGESVLEEILGGVELPFLYFRHRPDTDTPLKKKASGERPVNISEDLGDVLRDYIQFLRADGEDEYGRKALLASKKSVGRISLSGIRIRAYELTQPCQVGKECPHDRDPQDCDARVNGQQSRCPSVRSPHKWRTGSVTWHRDRGWPPEDIATKMATSVELVNSVYDQPEKLKRMSIRRQNLDKLYEK
ncbi:site-specific integrase [Halorubrum sp. CBA1229]|uniref:tyrosine-type recombinase/integrase n=1 Tax=Halorubrum sp. CBA1229 TaxID=1853699 RepID=UPI000F408E14|nr:site-specific integrase [Halorubrum sp. CBA1229]QKY17721.1 site-specific integrase [Halorubrum sp. CBA1229]